MASRIKNASKFTYFGEEFLKRMRRFTDTGESRLKCRTFSKTPLHVSKVRKLTIAVVEYSLLGFHRGSASFIYVYGNKLCFSAVFNDFFVCTQQR